MKAVVENVHTISNGRDRIIFCQADTGIISNVTAVKPRDSAYDLSRGHWCQLKVD